MVLLMELPTINAMQLYVHNIYSHDQPLYIFGPQTIFMRIIKLFKLNNFKQFICCQGRELNSLQFLN